MRSIYYTLQRLRDQKKKERQRQFAEAEALRRSREEDLDRLRMTLKEERSISPKTAGEMTLHDRLLVNRFFEVVRSEDNLKEQEEKVEICQEELRYAQQQSKIMEEVISSIESKEALERKRTVEKLSDEIGTMAWWRRK
jgi:hypothetical protein